jgi:hypothetical protein
MITNARKIACYDFFPPTALSARIRISHITPPDSAVLIYTPKRCAEPVSFDGPETTTDVPVKGHEMYAQPVLGNTDYQMEFLGYIDDI